MGAIKNSFSLYKRDIKALATNWAAMIIMGGLIMLPPLYAWFNIAASMDPYSNTGVLKTGIVSYDKGADINGTHINAGNDVMDELRENKSLNWVFYKTEEEAVNAVRFGEAYAAIVIPEDFSNDLISVMSDEPKKAVIDYYENDKINAITPKIMQKGAETLQEEVNASFVAAASKAILEELKATGMELSSNETKLKEYKEDLYDLDGRMPDIIFTIDNAVKLLDKNLDATPRIHQRVTLVRGMLNNSLMMSDSIDRTLNASGMDTGAARLRLERNFSLIQSALSESVDIGADLADLSKGGNRFLRRMLQNSSKSVGYVQSSIPEIAKTLTEAQGISESVHKEAQKTIRDIETLLSDYYAFLRDAETKIAADGADAKGIADVVLNFNQKLKDAFDALGQIVPIPLPDNVQQNLDYLYNTVSKFLTSVSQEDLAKEMKAAADLLLKSIDTADPLLDDYYGIIDSVSSMTDASSLNRPLNNLLSFRRTLGQVRNGLSDLQTANDNSKATAHIREIDKLLSDLRNELSRFNTDYHNAVSPALNTLSADVNVVRDDAKTLLNLLIQDLNLFESLLYEATENGQSVDTYLKKLQNTLPSAQGDIRNIANRLRNLDSAYGFDNIIETLVSSDAEKKDFFASPTELNATRLFPIPNYGSASAPFYTVLALWVGTLLLSSMLKLEVSDSYTTTQQFIGKYLLFFTVTQIQALVVTTGDLLIVGVYAAQPVLFVLLGMFTSFIFSMIVFSLVTVFGDVGKALGVVLLVLQLSASGGTFPIELTPGFFQAIHPYLPFTYAIDAVREAVGGVIPELLAKNIKFLLIFYVAAAVFGLKLKGPINKIGHGFMKKLRESEIFEG